MDGPVQVGHVQGASCLNPIVVKDFVVIAENGIHVLNIQFCGCTEALDRYEQLLEIGWWPATPLQPSTAATFGVLRHFQTVNLVAATPATDYYRSLEKITDGSGLLELPVSVRHNADCDRLTTLLGSTSTIYDNYTGVVAHKNGQTSWKRT